MSWTPKEAEDIRKLRGGMSAVNVARMYKVSPETIRRLWRGETYPTGQTPEPAFTGQELPPELVSESDAMLEELMAQQQKGLT